MSFRVAGICNAYESGYGHHDRDLPNPYSTGSDEYHAYAYGKEVGAERAAAGARDQPAPRDDPEALRAEVDRLTALLNSPELVEFRDAVVREAAHQRERWPEGHDRDKTPEEWLWLVAYLATKATQAKRYGDDEKYRHHIVTTAAACANWHASLPPPDPVHAPPHDQQEPA